MEKLYAHQGCFLALPDTAYDSLTPPYCNTGALAEEAEFLRVEIREAGKMGFDGFVQLFSGLDDLVAYEELGHPDAVQRRVRAGVLGAVERGLVEHAHAHGMKYFLQNYDLMLDAWVAARITAETAEPLLRARFREVFERTGCDGLIVTPSEVYDRGTSVWSPLFAGREGLLAMASLYQKLIVDELGRELRFRLWLSAETLESWDILNRRLPGGLCLAAKDSAGDFWLDAPLNPVLRSAGSGRNIGIIFDAFHQYHGWGKVLALEPRWPSAAAACEALGVRDIQIWGSWSPGCIWPNRQAGYLDGASAEWAGQYWENGLWKGGAVMALLNIRYLMALFEGCSKSEALRKAGEAEGFAADAGALCEAAEAIETWWREYYLPSGGRRYELLHGWATIFQIPRKTWRHALSRPGGPESVRESTARMELASARIRRAGGSLRDGRLRTLWERSLLFFETHEAVRHAVLADPALLPRADERNTWSAVERLRWLVGRWEREYPVEGRLWQFTETAPPGTRPVFLRRGSLADYADSLPSRSADEIPSGDPWAMDHWSWEEEHARG